MLHLTSQSIGRKKGPGGSSWFDVEIDGKCSTPACPRGGRPTRTAWSDCVPPTGLCQAATPSITCATLTDFNGIALASIWSDTAMSGSADRKRYVVQTNPKVIARCIIDDDRPGDFVIDPTCGGGTSALWPNSTVDVGSPSTPHVWLSPSPASGLDGGLRLLPARPARARRGWGLRLRDQPRVTLGQIAKSEDPETVAVRPAP